MTTGENIKKYRKKAHLTQKELAEKCGLAHITIQQYERGLREPRLETVFKISKVLGVLPTLIIDDLQEELSLWIENHPDTYDRLIFDNGNSKTNSDMYLEDTIEKMKPLLELLNHEGQGIAIERVEELTQIPKYQEKEHDNTRWQTSPDVLEIT